MNLGLASIQRYEGQSLVEWLAYYLLQGVDKFIIYNHNMPGAAADPAVETWKQLQKFYNIERHDCTGYDNWPRTYQHIMDTYRHEFDWMIWADGDEFYLPVEKPTIKDVLQDYDHLPISALGIYWTQFGSSGHITEPALATQSFTHRADHARMNNHHLNSIVKGSRAGQIYVTNPHVYTTEFGTYDVAGRLIPTHCGCNFAAYGCPGQVTHDVMRINHYYSKSWEYFKTRKQVRGPGDRPPEAQDGFITDEWYHANDFNEVEETLIWDKYGTALVEKINEINAQLGLPDLKV
jgi:hypothetical protein